MQDLFNTTGAIFSDCGQYRYKLWRFWNHDLPNVMFIGLNPSTADAYENDRTINRCMKFAQKWGYGGLFMANLFAYRSTWPSRMKKHYETLTPTEVQTANILNELYISEMAKESKIVIFAWGADHLYFDRDKRMIEMFPNGYCLDKSRHGHPRHPLYLKGDLYPIIYAAPAEHINPSEGR